MIKTVIAALAVAVMLVAPAFASPASHPKLQGVVGVNDAYKITLKDSGGKLVKSLAAGTYTLVVKDASSLHNYELDGPHGKSWTFTSVPFKGTKTVTLKLTPGSYKAYCVAHESIMFQRFTVK